jgi:hypothetical protein
MSDQPSRVLLLEFNELCPSLIQRWIKSGLLPNFKRFYEQSEIFTTDADVESPELLEPWIQWYSMHTGLSFDQHEVMHLTDGPKAGHADIWSVLAENGCTVGNFGSMNAKARKLRGSFHLSDPWCSSQAATPPELQTFQDYVAQQVQEYSNPDREPAGALDFVKFMATHGMKISTAVDIASRLLAEKTSDRGSNWKRATILDRLQLDAFRWYYRHYRPDFASFFVNSTAHFQHSYWRFFEPHHFQNEPSSDEMNQYGRAIQYGYERMDKLLGKFQKMVDKDTLLILSTALSQQPFVRNEAVGGQHFYRPRDVDQMLKVMGIESDNVDPVMTHQFLASLKDQTSIEASAQKLRSLTVEGKQVFEVVCKDGQIHFGCQLSHKLDEDTELFCQDTQTTTKFFDEFYSIDATKSGCHHPDGVLWFRTGNHQVHDEHVSILDVFPTLLDMFKATAEDEPGLPRNGQSLFQRLYANANQLEVAVV